MSGAYEGFTLFAFEFYRFRFAVLILCKAAVKAGWLTSNTSMDLSLDDLLEEVEGALSEPSKASNPPSCRRCALTVLLYECGDTYAYYT